MKLKCEVGLFIFTLMLLLVVSMLFIKNGYSDGEQEINFEILEKGDVSGYYEENYNVVGNDDEWSMVWERHTSIREPAEPPPDIDFSRFMVVCAFMGWRPTTGYSISVERVWTNGEKVFVEIVKRAPPKGLIVCQMVTCPFVMVLVEKTELQFVFHVVDESGATVEYVLGEFPSTALAVMPLAVLSAMVIALKIKKIR